MRYFPNTGEKMKILHIPTGGVFNDGILSCILAYLNAIDRTDMELTVLATNNPDKAVEKQVEDSGCGLYKIPYRRTDIKRYYRELKKYLKREQFDIVHVHGSSAIMGVELLAAKRAGIKVRIAHSHNTFCENKKADMLMRPLFGRLYTAAFACGRDAGRWLFGKKPFTVIPNARNLADYEYNADNRAEFRKSLAIPESSLVLGHVGRFNYQKNHEFLVEIFAEVLKKSPDAYLVLVGTGDNVDNIKRLVGEKGIADNVIFTGVSTNIKELLSAFDIMVLPSRYEGLPIVVLEWQAAGLPCFISDSVTDECKVCGNVYFESLQSSPSEWARRILAEELADRESGKDRIRAEMTAAGYEINSAAARLRSLYEKLLYGEK